MPLFYPELSAFSPSLQPELRLAPENAVDLAVDSNGELLVNDNGDLILTKPNESIGLNLLRRVSTPIGGYSRVAPKADELEIVDAGYENPLVNSISAPLTPEFSSWALNSLVLAASQDSRVTIVDAKIVPDQSKVHLSVSYAINGRTQTNQISL
jgi:hypothetical protein